ncbi:MAG TPA: MHYT domain-containing protein [Burkholderiales bacterium]|nr:MHYT domain-containing protein [Burkholderiales bacterium]
MAGQYNYSLVLVSVIVAAFASYTALDLASRITASRGSAARAWLWGGAFAMGVGIWSMHFIGMLAFNSPIPLGYDLLTTLVSLLIAIIASGFALHVVSRLSLSWQLLAIAAVIMGVAIVSMHYVGMAAIVLDPPLSYNSALVIASIAVAIAASLAALGMAFKLRLSSRWPRVLKFASAIVMGIAISGMHYTAMAAVHIDPNAVCLSGAVTDKFWLAGAVTSATIMILSVTLALSLMDARLAARTQRMTASLEHAHETNKAKDEFLAMLGHELRNPLAAISNALALLDRAELRNPSSQLARDIIERQTKHLRRMTDDLMEVGRVMAGKMTLHAEPLDLYACVTNAAAAMTASERARQHNVECYGESVWIQGDATRLEQIVANLLTNAFNYSPIGTSVVVRVQRSRDKAILTVTDNGIGLAADELPRVFDLFYQSNPEGSQHRAGGLGIGLTLVRRLVELHGGTIQLTSGGLGMGTTVQIRFPAIEHVNADKRAASADSHERQHKIVLIEDDRDVLESLRVLLVRKGHEVITAKDGESGLDQIKKERPDVSIIDVATPRIDGYKVAQQVRANKLPVFLIAITGYGESEDERRARSAGFDAHLTKPADLQKLEELLATAP